MKPGRIERFISTCLVSLLVLGIVNCPVTGVNAYSNENYVSLENKQSVKFSSSVSQSPLPLTLSKTSQKLLSTSESGIVNAYSVPASNLIVNGDFEYDPNYYGSWKAFNYSTNISEFYYDDQTFHGSSGNSVSIQGNNVNGAFVNSVSIQPGQTYSFGAWCKVLNVTHSETEIGVCVYIGQYDESGALIDGTDNYFTTDGTTGWQQANLNLVAYKNAKSVMVVLMLEGSGAVWFDDVSLVNTGAIPIPSSKVVANPGPSRSTYKGFDITLDGTKSLTTQGSTLKYNWSFVSKPEGSQSGLTNGNTSSPRFIPDVAGDYILSLSVDNGLGSTDSSQVTIRAKEFNDMTDDTNYNFIDYTNKSVPGYNVSDMVPMADGWAIISDINKNQIVILNTITGEIAKTYQLTASPSKIDFDFDKGIIFATQAVANRVAKINVNTDEISYISFTFTADAINDVVIGENNIVFALFNKWPQAHVSVVDIDQGIEITNLIINCSNVGIMVYDKNLNNLILGVRGISPSALFRCSYDENSKQLTLHQSVDTLGSNGQDLSISNDGRHVAFCCGSGNGGYTIYDIDSTNITNRFGDWNTGAYPTSAAFSMDNKYIVTENYDEIQLFDVYTHTFIRTIAQIDCYEVEISRGGKIIYSINGNGIGIYKTDGTSTPSLNIDSISADPSYPQITGTKINVTANVSGGSGNNFYNFWVCDGNNWTLEQAYSTSNTFEWTPPAAGEYDLLIEAKDKSSNNNYDTFNITKYFVDPNETDPVSVSITGADRAGIPVSGTASSLYHAQVENVNGQPLENESVTWSVFDYNENPTTQLSIDNNGLLTVDSSASVGTYYIMAKSATIPSVYGTKSIEVGYNSILVSSNINYNRDIQNPNGIPILVNFRGNSLVAIKNGDTELVYDTDYTVLKEGVIIIYGSYLAGLPEGKFVLTLIFSAGDNAVVDITITDYTPTPVPTQEPTPTPTTALTPTPTTAPTPTPTTAPNPTPTQAPTGGGSDIIIGGGGFEESPAIKPENGTVTVEPTKNNGTAIYQLNNIDYTALINSANEKDGLKNVLLNVKDVGLAKYEIKLDPSVLSGPNGNVVMTISTAVANAALPSDILKSDALQGAKSISVNICSVDKATLPEGMRTAVGDSAVVDIFITVDGKVIEWNNPNAPVTISIPYTLKAGETGDNITVFFIDGQGKLVNMQGIYDSNKKLVTFTTTHFSKYLAKNNEVPFNDLSGYESYSRYIQSMAAKGIIEGVGNNNYAPGKVLTRAEFATLLVKMLKLGISDNSIVFSDSKANDWFVPYINAAYKAGLIKGIGNNKFAPNDTISTQDAALILVRAMKLKGITITAGSLSGITDGSDISSYARDGVGFIVTKAIIPLDSAGNFNAKNKVNRACAAQYIYNIFNYAY